MSEQYWCDGSAASVRVVRSTTARRTDTCGPAGERGRIPRSAGQAVARQRLPNSAFLQRIPLAEDPRRPGARAIRPPVRAISPRYGNPYALENVFVCHISAKLAIGRFSDRRLRRPLDDRIPENRVPGTRHPTPDRHGGCTGLAQKRPIRYRRRSRAGDHGPRVSVASPSQTRSGTGSGSLGSRIRLAHIRVRALDRFRPRYGRINAQPWEVLHPFRPSFAR